MMTGRAAQRVDRTAGGQHAVGAVNGDLRAGMHGRPRSGGDRARCRIAVPAEQPEQIHRLAMHAMGRMHIRNSGRAVAGRGRPARVNGAQEFDVIRIVHRQDRLQAAEPGFHDRMAVVPHASQKLVVALRAFRLIDQLSGAIDLLGIVQRLVGMMDDEHVAGRPC
jgi:hypothetical protein